MKGTLYLIPSTLGETSDPNSVIPSSHFKLIPTLDGFIAEKAKTARAFLKHFDMGKPMYEVVMQEYNKRTDKSQLESIIEPMKQGEKWGLLSEAGCPAIADPGSDLVRLAYKNGIQVVPLVGPSSIFLALMASGLNGQNFCFDGYLPSSPDERKKRLKQIEKDSQKFRRSHIFMETPYRNPHLFRDAIEVLDGKTSLCVATDITLKGESIMTQSVEEWRKAKAPDIHKRPTMFVLSA